MENITNPDLRVTQGDDTVITPHYASGRVASTISLASLRGQYVALTGVAYDRTGKQIVRDELIRKLKEHGIIAQKSISRQTNYLSVGVRAGKRKPGFATQNSIPSFDMQALINLLYP